MGVGPQNVFEIRHGEPNHDVFDAGQPLARSSALDLLSEDHGNIAPSAIYDAVMTLPLFGSLQADAGLIENFDVLITWHPQQYYDRISFECIRQAMARFGDEGRLAIEPLLEEAGHSTDISVLRGMAT